MMWRSSDPDLIAIRRGVETIGRLSDGLLRVGPWSIGLDGVLSWIPAVGEAYSIGAAAYLLVQGARARAPLSTLIAAAALMGGRTAITALPLVGPLVADALTLHKWSARMIVRAIDRRLSEREAAAAEASAVGVGQARADKARTRFSLNRRKAGWTKPSFASPQDQRIEPALNTLAPAGLRK